MKLVSIDFEIRFILLKMKNVSWVLTGMDSFIYATD